MRQQSNISENKDQLIQPIEGTSTTNPSEVLVKKTFPVTVIIVYSVLIMLGVGTGYVMTRQKLANAPLNQASNSAPVGTKITTDKQAGVVDTQTFKDSADGTIEAEGIDKVGTHKLIREGGPSKTAVLTSSTVDLDQFIGKSVRVWGETRATDKAAWLMDVGKVEILE